MEKAKLQGAKARITEDLALNDIAPFSCPNFVNKS
jgi:hypothetical protein